MSVRQLVQQQYQRVADRNAAQDWEAPPPEGWLRTVRKSLGMSGAQLARRMGVTRARIAQAETSEGEGGITLKSMQATAEAMGCRFVYAVVPEGGRIEDVILAQARRKATALVHAASKHMALESQVLPDESIAREIDRLKHQLARDMPADFWNEP
ncbi:mobile mystery protein A [Tardiphaga alba]|uniref:Mobile mystery protein A n=1 Tax=Tardiphaga alba TaxID=340268 RepID=A0ABX8AAP7_9BRAD|nr:mobile mystery protein A [Tardiphaga alba]QUS40846.1 mobile mystery protein A [Tardiphaga alba]